MKEIAYLFYFSLCSSVLLSQNIERIEPPHWYVGMHNPELQLMVYAENIQSYKVDINRKGVKFLKVHKPNNQNYIFLDLVITDKAKAGRFDIKFSQNGKKDLKYSYELKKRLSGSALRNSFSSKDVIYLITPDRFANGDTSNDTIAGMKEGYDRSIDYGRHGGDLRGIINNLDYIKEMGYTALWLNPVLVNDQTDWSYHGYATTDYYKIDPRFGTTEDYLELCSKAKDLGIGIIKDLIANHCGHQHWWMNDLPSSDWINYQSEEYQQTNHRKYSLVDPYVDPSERDIMIKGWFVPTMPDLNQKNPFLAKYIIQNTIWWVEYAGLYGIRQDTYSYPYKDFMTEWTCAVMNEYPNFNIVGEEWVDDPALISYWLRDKINHDGYESCLPSIMDFPLNFILHKAINEKEEWGKGLIKLYEHLGRDYHYPDPQELMIMADNHDMSRIFTLLEEDIEKLKMAMTYLLTMRGVPQILYGTEVLMSHPESNSHGAIRSDFPGGWKGDDVNGFSQTGLSQSEIEFQNWFKKLLNWRKTNNLIHNGKLMHYEPQKGVYVYFRYDEDNAIMTILNKNKEDCQLPLDRFKLRLQDFSIGYDLFSEMNFDLSQDLNLAANQQYILELE